MTKVSLEESFLLPHVFHSIRSGLAKAWGPATWFGEAKVPWMLLRGIPLFAVPDVRALAFEQKFSGGNFL